MFVKSLMIPKHKVHSVEKGTSVGEALTFMERHQIDGVPVLEGSHYLGLVTKWLIFESGFKSELKNQSFLETVTVESVAIKVNHTIDETAVFEETVVEVKDVPFVPVVESTGQFLGIVTRYDLIEQFQSAFGMSRNGIRIAFSSVETEGRLARLSKITRDFHLNIISLATFDETDKLVRRIVMKIEPTPELKKFLSRLEKNGFTVLDVKETD